MVRNAVDHGLETPAEREAAGKPVEGMVRLHAMQLGSEVVLTVTDDGRGLDLAAVRERAGATDAGTSDEDAAYLIFRSGVSTATHVTDVSGRGVGLDAVRRSLSEVRGRVEVHSTPGQGCEFRLSVPITVAVLPSLIVEAAGQRYAVPLHSVVTVLAPEVPLSHAEGAPSVRVDSTVVPVASLAAALGLDERPAVGPVVVLTGLSRRFGLRVDALHGRREVVVKALPDLLGVLDAFTGASVEPTGQVLLVLDAEGTIARARTVHRRHEGAPMVHRPARKAELLVVDDALTVRELQRSILEKAGYSVRTASDGQEALAMLLESPADLVLTDVEMPNLDGFALTEAIRAHDALAGAAVLILTSRAGDEDRRRGLDAGADGYLVKSAFDEAALLSAVARLLGEPAAGRA
jgi:two-component system, chemotaxis family, sensor kinase CheA